MDLALVIIWGILGLINLLIPGGVSKTSYAFTWVVLMIQLISNLG